MSLLRRTIAVAALAAVVVACAENPPEPPAAPPRPSPPPPALEARVRACVFAASCARPTDAAALRDPTTCVTRALALSEHVPALRCLESARSCADVDACLGRGRDPEEAKRSCDAHPGALVFCDGNRLVSCEGDRPRLTYCAELRGTCSELRVSNGIVVRGCASNALCDGNAPPQRCDGEAAIVTCQQGLAERARCPVGTRCREESSGGGEVEARCVPVGTRPCVPGAIDRCEGTKLVSCLVGEDGRGTRVETDCAASGLRCGSMGQDAACIAGDHCQPGAAKCEGGVLRFCAAGIPVNAHCDRYGLGACRASTNGAAACATER
jgi:hypothetical protein